MIVVVEVIIPPIEFSYFSKQDMNYITLTSNAITLNATLDTLSPSKTSFNAQEDIQFLKQNTLLSRIIAILNNRWFGLFIVGINGGFILLFLLQLIKSKRLFVPNTQQKRRKKIIRHIHTLNDQTSLIEMEKVLVDVLSYFTDYEHPGINPKDVELSLVKAELSDPLVKGTMQWIKNTQLLRYSKDKGSESNHSNSESLRRILNNIITEKETK